MPDLTSVKTLTCLKVWRDGKWVTVCGSSTGTSSPSGTDPIVEGGGGDSFHPVPFLERLFRGELKATPEQLASAAKTFRALSLGARRTMAALPSDKADFAKAADVTGYFRVGSRTVRIGEVKDKRARKPETAAEVAAVLGALAQASIEADTLATALHGAAWMSGEALPSRRD